VYLKGDVDWSEVPELQQSILTNNTVIEVTDFGDMTKYEYDSIYALGYRVLYKSTSGDQMIKGTDWTSINGSFFKVAQGDQTTATINELQISGPGGYNKDVTINVTGANIKYAKYRLYYATVIYHLEFQLLRIQMIRYGLAKPNLRL
jgi:hypothetical protein